MKLNVKRRYRGERYTIGSLFIDGDYFCDTLEDRDRGLTSEMQENEIIRRKIKDETAIPTGEYELSLKWASTKFRDKSWARQYKGIVPRLLRVPGYEGVLIHPGNDETSTSGCLLVGENKVKGKVINSQNTYHKLMAKLLEADNITIKIS